MAVCDDCGAPFDGDDLEAAVKHGYTAHPGLPRVRWTSRKGSYIACVDDGYTIDAKSQYSKVSGQTKDPIDRMGAHLESHQEVD